MMPPRPWPCGVIIAPFAPMVCIVLLARRARMGTGPVRIRLLLACPIAYFCVSVIMVCIVLTSPCPGGICAGYCARCCLFLIDSSRAPLTTCSGSRKPQSRYLHEEQGGREGGREGEGVSCDGETKHGQPYTMG